MLAFESTFDASTHDYIGDPVDHSDPSNSDSSDSSSNFSSEIRLDDVPLVMANESDEEEDYASGTDNLEANGDLTEDPLFVPRGTLFDEYQSGQPDESDDDESDPLEDIHPTIVNMYVRAFVAATFHGATHGAIKNQLDGNHLTLESVQGAAPNLHFPGFSDFARTLPTIERRLGLSTSAFITYYILCSQCWKPHHPNQLSRLPASCEEPDCSGTIFTSKRLSDNSLKRTPVKVLSYVDPRKAIQRMLLRPGKLEQLQSWRSPGDDPQRIPPTTATGINAFTDASRRMNDIHDGYGWRMIQAGLKRQNGGKWEMEDVDVKNLNQRFVSLPCGLVWQINIDWYVVRLGRT